MRQAMRGSPSAGCGKESDSKPGGAAHATLLILVIQLGFETAISYYESGELSSIM